MAPPDSRTIYAYCNVRTKQVVYSLKATLHNAHVRRQLPDTGANTSFVALRKDLWHPLWTLSLPQSEHAEAQTKHAFKKLREWRKLHETCWEPPPLLSKPFSEAEIEGLKERLDNRGGSKTESVFDVIRRKKRKMRVKEVLNQKANSVADLAAVLIEQDQLGAETSARKAEESRRNREWQVRDMLQKSRDAEAGELATNEARIAELEELKATADRLGEADWSKTQLRKELQTLRKLTAKMKFAVKAVAEARNQAGPIPATNAERAPSNTEQTNENGTETATTDTVLEQEVQHLLPVIAGYPIPNTSVPKKGPLRAKIRRETSPVFTTEGIKIKWSDTLDAEFAEYWPETVEHEPMGFSRHRAPHASAEPVLDIADARQQQMEKVQAKRAAALAEQRALGPSEALESVKIDVLSKVRQAVEARREATRQRMQAQEGEALA